MDENNFIPRKEHEEFAKRQDEENHRQNRRIGELEETVRQIGVLTSSVEKLASTMESMLKEQEKQGKRLEVTGYIITTVIGIVVGYIFTRIGM